ncbi:SAM-dependent methyltransferase [Microbacterium immunditiarum]|uniref:SAM-dependent methyltransferase n=1 Tax=Microbacterium immunditiarum TaxID=337480 RepID=A0A7Y9GMU8_9MICO|nr:SAM-dependent methyltransferase [Microbacterium immunditiarum]NYE19241.1 hypothetical protein [Microbacterium immunditiarum]
MTSISVAAPDWLAQRAIADDASRSVELAEELARMLPPGPLVVHDLGAGTGAMTRWLAPRLGGPQRWVLRDGDEGILHHVDLAATVDAEGRPVVAEATVEDLTSLPPDAFHGASAVTASALLDVITAEEAAHIVAACVDARTPALFSLTVTGAVRMGPSDAGTIALESEIAAAFNDHQRRETAGRRLLGPDAVSLVATGFEAAGWSVRRAPTPWRLAATDGPLIAQWLDGWLRAAVEERSDLARPADELRRTRLAQNALCRLRVTVSHEDLLAWPPQPPGTGSASGGG